MMKHIQNNYILILTLILLGVSLAEKTHNHTFRDGAIITELKPVKLVRGELILKINLYDLHLDTAVETIKAQLPQPPNRTDGALSVESYLKLTQCTQLTWRNFTKMNKRNKRGVFKGGLLNIGGDLFHGLFGLSTDRELNDLQDNLDDKIKFHSIEINELLKITKEQQVAIKLLHDQQEFWERHLMHSLDVKLHWLTLLEVCEAYNQLRVDLELGHVNMELLDIEHIAELVKTYGTMWGLQPVTPVNDIDFERTINIQTLRVTGGRLALLSIPFVDQTTYEGLEIIEFPMLIHGAHLKIGLDVKKTHLIIDELRTMVAPVDTNYIRKCKTNYKFLICPNPVMLNVKRLVGEICELNMLLRNNYTHCSFNRYSKNYVRAVKRGHELFLTAAPHEVVSISCTLSNVTVTKMTEAGIGIFPSNCQLTSLHVTYFPTKHKTLYNLTNFGQIVITPTVFFNQTKVGNAQVDDYIRQASKEIAKLENLTQSNWTIGTETHKTLTLIILIMLTVIIFGASVCVCLLRGQVTRAVTTCCKQSSEGMREAVEHAPAESGQDEAQPRLSGHPRLEQQTFY